MADEEKTDSSGFRVVDRRPFTSEGERVPGHPEEEQFGREPEQPVRTQTSAAPSAGAEPEAAIPEESERFAMLVSYLSTTAMFQLGLLPGPGGDYIPADLANARRTIDLLDVLQEKTSGNLTQQEAKLLDEVLYELRMTFVEVEKRASKKK